MLSALCSVSKDTVLHILSDIDYYQLVSVELLREEDVQSQVEASIDLVRTSTSIEITSFLNYLKLTYRASQLVSALGTNAVIYQGSDEPFFWGLNYPFKTFYVRDGFCAGSNTVGRAFFIPDASTHYEDNDKDWLSVFNEPRYDYDVIDPSHVATIEGYFGGCYTLDALFSAHSNAYTIVNVSVCCLIIFQVSIKYALNTCHAP